MTNKWEELKKFLEDELTGLLKEQKDQNFRPEQEREMIQTQIGTLNHTLNRMRILEDKVRKEGGF